MNKLLFAVRIAGKYFHCVWGGLDLPALHIGEVHKKDQFG